MKYAIIDIETTGLYAKKERITEIAILVHDGNMVVDEFISLVNPEIKIPYRIKELTGITDAMVAMAPRFCEIAREVLEITRDCIFVAHNASFDYHFVKEEFLRLGYNYDRQVLCTKRLSRKLLPGLRSYGLGNLCKTLDIKINHRHRAFGDARATVLLFEYLLGIDQEPENLPLRGITTHLSKEKLKALPETPGVYYFYNDEGSIIYIGKSKNIKERVLSHLSNQATRRATEMRDQIYDVGYEECGSELIALLLESEEVKKHTPRFNRLLRRKTLQWGLYRTMGTEGYIHLAIRRNESPEAPVTTFSSKSQARDALFALVEKYCLCQKLCGLYTSGGACFHYQIHQCNGACIGEELPEEYNRRVTEALAPWSFTHKSFFVVDNGRNNEEKSVVMVENNRYCGFGYFPADEPILQPGDLASFIVKKPDHRDAHQVIRSYLKQQKGKYIPG